jgi:HD-GYP domain-containing protein (c-di-GMP phosphodiesterase class II)
LDTASEAQPGGSSAQGGASLVLLCGILPTIAVALLSLGRPAAFTHFEYGVYDRLTRAISPHKPRGHVAIVDVDERSLAAIGQWPWRRDTVATLLSKIRELGAPTIGVDVIFAESDRRGGEDDQPDAALAKTLREGRVVLGYAMRFDGQPDAGSCTPPSLGLSIAQADNDDEPVFRATGAICSLPELTAAAGAQGFLNAAPDSDGILRRVPLLLRLGDGTYPSLALATVAAMAGTRNLTLRVENGNANTLVMNGHEVPLDGRSNLLVRYRGKKQAFRYVSAADVMQDRVPAGAFADTLVMVGTTALGTREVVATPLDTLFVGVEVQATVADNLLQADFFGRPPHAVAVETFLAFALGVIATLVVRRIGGTWGSAAVVAAVVALWTGSAALLSSAGTFLSPLYPTVALGASLAAMTVAGLVVERRRADRAGVEKEGSQRLMVQTLLSLTGIRDAETGRHSRRTQRYARVLAQELARHPLFRDYLTPDRVELVASLAPLHDIGKVGVPDAVLNKPGHLTPEERAEMCRHPEYGRDVILKAEREAGIHDELTLTVAKDIVYTHHEKWDGTGYPQGLRGAEIPIPGRLMAVVDVYDAVRTRKLYDAPVSQHEAVAIIIRGKGTHFDPAVVEAFLRVSPVFDELSALES